MKKLLGFFSILGFTSSLSASSATAFTENNYDWSNSFNVLESINKVLNKHSFVSLEEFNSFINSEIYSRVGHLVKENNETIKPSDILLTYKFDSDNSVIFKASMFKESNNGVGLEIDDESVSIRTIIINMI